MKKVLPVQGTGGKVPQGAYSLERDRDVSDQYIDTILNSDKRSEKKINRLQSSRLTGDSDGGIRGGILET